MDGNGMMAYFDRESEPFALNVVRNVFVTLTNNNTSVATNHMASLSCSVLHCLT